MIANLRGGFRDASTRASLDSNRPGTTHMCFGERSQTRMTENCFIHSAGMPTH